MAEPRIVVSDGEYRLLKKMKEKGFREGTVKEAARILGVPESTIESLASLLSSKNLLSVETRSVKRYRLTERGEEALRRGLPEEELLAVIEEHGGAAPVEEASRRLGGQRLAAAMRGLAGLVRVSSRDGVKVVEATGDLGEARRRIERLKRVLAEVAGGKEPSDREALAELLKRRLVAEEELREKRIRLLGDPESILSHVVASTGRITSSMLADGSWSRVHLARYDVRAEPPRVYPARLHFLQEFIEEIRDIMKEMGFTEVKGPLVEVELFNFDLLFQPQDHPAREIHDTLRPKLPPVSFEEKLADMARRVRRVHERGWGYKWSAEAAGRRVMRSQMTSVSARLISGMIYGEPPAEPMRFFSIGRVFRRDPADARHLPEFHQLDGVEGWSGYTFRDLLGTLKEFAERVGLEVKFKPAYFPFTEPSVEGYARLPDGRWIELFGAGLFRPEVLEMAGLDYPVGAWGMGIERLAAAYYGVPDIRKLYTRDVSEIKAFRVRL
ncbi:phenylalanine--tRNA ligase subunit alpha [Stetteria hydrogenophila]